MLTSLVLVGSLDHMQKYSAKTQPSTIIKPQVRLLPHSHTIVGHAWEAFLLF